MIYGESIDGDIFEIKCWQWNNGDLNNYGNEYLLIKELLKDWGQSWELINILKYGDRDNLYDINDIVQYWIEENETEKI